MEQLGYGADYKYAHDFPGHFVQQQFMPDELKDTRVWQPQEQPAEAKLAERLRALWNGKY